MQISISKPSKKIIILIVVAAAAIVGMLLNKFWPFGEKPAGVIQNIVTPGYEATSFKGDASFIDADDDGIQDWRQQLLDGDAATLEAASTTDNAPKTVSESVARSLFANAVYLSNNGEKDITESDQNALAESLVTELQKAFVYKEYTSAGLAITTGASKEDIRIYATNFATFQINTILTMQKRMKDITGDISILADIYAKEALYLYNVKVPLEVAASHLKIVNNFSKVAAALKVIANQKEDPLQVPLAIRVYQDAETSQSIEISNIADFISKSGIIFTKNDAGVYWSAFNRTQ